MATADDTSAEPSLTLGRRAVQAVDRAAFQPKGGVASPSYAGRSHPPAFTLARMIDALNLQHSARVLLVGSGSGYAAAALAQVCQHVYGIERVESLVEVARTRLTEAGVLNVTLRTGDGRRGWPDHAPYDAVLVMSALGDIPIELYKQLLPGGALVIPVGSRRNEQPLVRLRKPPKGDPIRDELGTVVFSDSLGEMLVTLGVAKAETIARAEAIAVETGKPMTDELRRLARLDDADLARALAATHGMKFGTLDQVSLDADPHLFEQVPRAFCDHHQLIPIAREGNVVRVVGTRPDAPFGDIEHVFPGVEVEPWLVTPTDFKRLWSTLELRQAGHEYHSATLIEAVPEGSGSEGAQDLLAQKGEGDLEAHAVSIFEALLLDAIGERASDIHLERYGDVPRVRLRVDGDLIDIPRYKLSPIEMIGVVNVIKVRSHLDISEKRLPQGGRTRLRAGGKIFDLRVQTQPSLHGEHVVIRLLPQDQKLLSIEDLGFPAEVAKHYRRLLDNPAGQILVVGPTGSGKSTTLYAALQVLAHDTTRKVITIEDPIEYSIDGIQQTQVKPEIGFAFADAMRSFVRQDPDVILVGEVRDAETALEAIRASQTGHLVLSTLHCNDATDAVQRLFDLGMHPNSIASELLAVISQRLAKRVCESCRTPAEPEPDLLAEIFPAGAPADFRCFKGKGCPRCSGHGTRGRIAVIEFMRATPPVRGAISRHVPVDEMRRIAVENGLYTARDSALDHVMAGRIPLAELRSLLPSERMAGEV